MILPQHSVERRRVLALLVLLLSFLVLVACDEGSGPAPQTADFEVDPVFRSFYENLGGKDILGPAISPLFSHGGVNYQYTATCLMINDPKAADNRLFDLAPLGKEMRVDEPPVLALKGGDDLYLNGHVVYREFVPMFKQLGGSNIAGKPLTGLHYNALYSRYEQYFENTGFYILEGDPQRTVKLLTYGAWKCGSACRPLPENFRLASVAPHSPVEGSFAEGMKHMGAELTGFAISEAYQAKDGYTEQVFENVVLFISPQNPGWAIPRPLTTLLGIQPEAPVLPIPNDPEMYFYRTRGDKGYNVPVKFLNYLAAHGGLDETAGSPIGEYKNWKGELFRQCFDNLCLIENPTETGLLRIHPDAMGYAYLDIIGRPPFQVQPPDSLQPTPEETQDNPPEESQAETATAYPEPQSLGKPKQIPAETQPPAQPAESNPEPQAGSNMAIKVWETFATVSPTQAQEINVYITADGLPVPRLEPRLTITLPDESTRTYLMFPTGEDGQSRFNVEPIEAANGTLIPYQVCIDNASGDSFCVLNDYIIWIGP